MPDEFLSQSRPIPARPAPTAGKTMLVVAALAFLLGAALVGWLAWKGTLAVGGRTASEAPAPVVSQVASLPKPTASSTPAPVPTPTQSAGEAVLDGRLASLEERLTRLDLQAQAAAGNAARAEGLLIVLATRRAIERGAQLGYLEDQLNLRFGAAQPNAVRTIVAEARNPVTLDRLVAQLDGLAPQLARKADPKSGWGSFRDQVTALFTIRRDSGPVVDPEDRLADARVLLQTGRVEAATAAVERLPGAGAAREWLGSARRYSAAMEALDLIEKSAILESRELQDSSGAKVQQLSPVTGPPA